MHRFLSCLQEKWAEYPCSTSSHTEGAPLISPSKNKIPSTWPLLSSLRCLIWLELLTFSLLNYKADSKHNSPGLYDFYNPRRDKCTGIKWELILEVRRINKGGDTYIGQAASFQISDSVKRPKEASGSVSTTFQKLFYYGRFPNYTKIEGKVERKRKKNITPYAHHPASTITNILPILLWLSSPPYLYFKASTRLPFHFTFSF